jgi:hypothetical protein
MLRKVTIFFGWGWALLNGAAFTLSQTGTFAPAIPGLDVRAAGAAVIPAIPGLDSQASAIALALAGVVLALIGHAWSAGKPTSRAKVARKISDISAAMLNFAEEREQMDEDVELTGDAFFDTECLADQSRETGEIYRERFAAEVAWAHAALTRFGVCDEPFSEAYEKPGDVADIHTLGAHLGALAERLKRNRR